MVMLKGREKEHRRIYELISTALEERHPQSIMVRGVPGSGKTETIKAVVAELKQTMKVVYAYINCTSITTKTDLYRRIHNIVTVSSATKKEQNKKEVVLAASEALKQTEKVLFKQNTVLVLDEIDYIANLDTARTSLANSIVKKVFDWPLQSGGKVVVIGISNELDFSEKVLPKKRVIMPEVVLFTAYTVNQLIDILTERFSDDENVTSDAIKLCARKISAMNGDVRRALSLLSTQLEFEDELEEEEEEEPVVLKRPKIDVHSTPSKSRPSTSAQSSPSRTPKTHKQILSSLQNIYSSPAVTAKIPLQPRIVLACILRLIETGTEKKKTQSVQFSKLLETYDKVCKKMKVEALNHEALRDALTTLTNNSLILMKKDKICVEVDLDVAKRKIQDDELIKSVSTV